MQQRVWWETSVLNQKVPLQPTAEDDLERANCAKIT